MRKYMVLLACVDGVSPEDFNSSWKALRARRILELPGLTACTRNMVVEEVRRDHRPAHGSGIACIEEIWIDEGFDIDVNAELGCDDAERAAGLHCVNVLAVDEHVIFDRRADPSLSSKSLPADALLKRFSLLKRRKGMSVEAFHDYWRKVHSPLASCHRFVERYSQNHVVASDDRFSDMRPDGVGEFLISDLARMQEDYESEAGIAMKADVANFVESVRTYLVSPVIERP